MESKKFIQKLRKVVREEVRSVIKQELTDILQEGLQSTISELQPQKQQIQEQVTRSRIPVTTKKNKVKFKKTKYSDILNETDSLKEQTNSGDYASMMNEDIVMTSKDAVGFGVQRNGSTQLNMVDPESGQNMKVDNVVAQAMTRDYSTLMKAIDKKKGR